MKTLCLIHLPKFLGRVFGFPWMACLIFLIFGAGQSTAQSVLFDFDNAPLQSPLPVSLTMGGITARFSATGQGYSIQNANAMGFVPQGFAGRCIYPSSVFLADLLIGFDVPLTDFSLLYACQELGCDDAATMRVTAYLNGSLVGTNTKTATFPGTWPSDTLACSFLQGFDSVVVHYDSRPPTCQDYGVIFMADNMRVTPQNGSAVSPSVTGLRASVSPNPIASMATLRFVLPQADAVEVSVHDIQGTLVKTIFDGCLDAGNQELLLHLDDAGLKEGVYFLRILSGDFSRTLKVLVVR